MNVDFDQEYDIERLTEEEKELYKDNNLGWADYQKDDTLKKVGKSEDELNSWEKALLNEMFPPEYKFLIKFTI